MWPRRYGLFETATFNPADANGAGAGDGGSGEGGGGGTDDGGGTLTAASLREFMTGLEGIGKEFKELNGHIRSANANPQPQPAPDDDDGEGEGDEPAAGDIDLDGMSRKDMLDLITNMNRRDLRTILKPIVQQLDQLSLNMTQNQLLGQIGNLSEKNKDYWDWKEEMKTLADQHPSLNPQEVYSLVRAKDPAKAADLDKKYNPAPKEEKRRPAFGGLQPNQGGRSGEKPKAMSMSDALEDAWAKTMEKHGDVLDRYAN